jgi:hypothetical protein
MKKSNIKFAYLDNNDNLIFKRHKLKRYKAKSLELTYIEKIYKLNPKVQKTSFFL